LDSARRSSLTRPLDGRDYDLTAAHLQSPALIMHQLDHLLSLVPHLYHGRRREV